MAGTFGPDTAAEIRDAILADIRLEAIGAGVANPAVQPGTEDWWFATAHANAAMLLLARIESRSAAVTPRDAVGADLEAWRESLGLPVADAAPSTGRIRLQVTGTSSMPDGTQFTFPNGLRGKVVGNYLSVTDGTEVNAVSIDTGERANFDAETIVRFVSPPLNVATVATVSRQAPFSGGSSKESEARKRLRILNAIGSQSQAAGSWGNLRRLILDQFPGVQDCYVYPALGGPASVKIVPVRDYDDARRDYSRAMSDAAIELIKAFIYERFPSGDEYVVQAAANQSVDVALQIEIPETLANGGDGRGWADGTIDPWPRLLGADNGRVTVTAVANATQITVSANFTVAPTAGQTHIAWWSPYDRAFSTYLVTARSGAAGAWVLTLDRPIVSSNAAIVAVGDFISPVARRTSDYGAAWVDILRTIGPGENTSSGYLVPRAARRPLLRDGTRRGIKGPLLSDFLARFDEVASVTASYRSATEPTDPPSVAVAPNIFVPRHFGVYPA